jgi:hypothetical protein
MIAGRIFTTTSLLALGQTRGLSQPVMRRALPTPAESQPLMGLESRHPMKS